MIFKKNSPGEPDRKSGIPPALINFRILDFLSRESKVVCVVERPIKINANIELWRQLFEVGNTLRTASGIDEIVKLVESGHVDDETTRRQKNDVEWRSRLSDLSRVTFSTKQVVLHLSENARFVSYDVICSPLEVASYDHFGTKRN